MDQLRHALPRPVIKLPGIEAEGAVADGVENPAAAFRAVGCRTRPRTRRRQHPGSEYRVEVSNVRFVPGRLLDLDTVRAPPIAGFQTGIAEQDSHQHFPLPCGQDEGLLVFFDSPRVHETPWYVVCQTLKGFSF